MIDRRTFGKAIGIGAAAVPLTQVLGTPIASATSQASGAPATVPMVAPGTHTSFARLKHVKAGLLNVAYAETGPAHGPVVICLHGWPYDIHSFVDVAPLLAAQGYRVIVPYLRGHGETTFLSRRTVRNAQQSAIALDVVALMDALRIKKAVLAGFGVVPVLLRHRARTHRDDGPHSPPRPMPPRMGHRLADLELRRRHLRAHGRRLRQPRLCGDGDPQLPLAAWPGRRRAPVRRSREAAGGPAGDHGTDRHP